MADVNEVRAPDGLVCEIVRSAWGFSPTRWNGPIDGSNYVPKEPSPGMRAHIFGTAEAAMMAAYRERVQQQLAAKSLGEGGPI